MINGFKQQIEPNIDAVSKLKAKGMITEIVNQTIKEDFSGKEYEENLFIIKSGKDDKVQMVQSNTSLINRMVAEFSVNLQKKYDEYRASHSKTVLRYISGQQTAVGGGLPQCKFKNHASVCNELRL